MSSFTSFSKIEGQPSMVSPAQDRRYSSPPPGAANLAERSRSPPPPPRLAVGVGKSDRGSESADVVFSEINSGRSILNPRPMDISKINLTRKSLHAEFEKEAENGNDRNVRPRTNSISGFVLVSPSTYPHFPSPSSRRGGDESEEEDEDMPPMPSPIRLSMRCGNQSSARARPSIAPRVPDSLFFQQRSFAPIAPRVPDASFTLRSFAPIRPNDDGDE